MGAVAFNEATFSQKKHSAKRFNDFENYFGHTIKFTLS